MRRCLDHCWIQDACSKQQALIATFVTSTEPPTVLPICQRHPKPSKTFHTICPPVQRLILLKLVLPPITYRCLLPACVRPLSLSYSCGGGGGGGGLGFHKVRADSLASLQVAGLKAAANLINHITNTASLMIASQSGITLITSVSEEYELSDSIF